MEKGKLLEELSKRKDRKTASIWETQSILVFWSGHTITCWLISSRLCPLCWRCEFRGGGIDRSYFLLHIVPEVAALLQAEGLFLSPVPHIVSKLNTFCLEFECIRFLDAGINEWNLKICFYKWNCLSLV